MSQEWKMELWEDRDYIITGFGLDHPGTLSKREAELVIQYLNLATPLIQKFGEWADERKRTLGKRLSVYLKRLKNLRL